MALLRELRPRARSAAGVWAIRNGEAIYAAALAQATTTTMTPDEVHRLGLAQVADLTARLDTILTGQGLTQGSVGARLSELNRQPAQLFAESDAGRAELLASLNTSVRAMQARLGQAFPIRPTRRSKSAASLRRFRTAPPTAIISARRSMVRAPAIYWIN